MIKLRLLEQTHINDRVRLLRSYDIAQGILMDQPISLEKSIEWLKNLNTSKRKDFVLLLNEIPIGFAGIVNIDQKNGTCEIYIFIDSNNQGKGHGTLLLNLILTYAKYELNLRKAIALVSSDNKKVVPFYQRIGFINEGLLKNHVWRKGAYIDRYIFSAFLDTITLIPQQLYESLT